MQELSYEEKLKLENTKEHLNVVLGNLRIANNELALVLKEAREKKVSVDESNKKLRQLGIVYEKILSDIRERNTVINNREKSITEREEKVSSDEEDSKRRLDSLNSIVKYAEDRLTRLELDYKKYRHELTVDLGKETEKIESLLYEIETYEDTKNKISQDIKELENERIRLDTEIENSKRTLKDLKAEEERELSRIRIEIELEKEKIARPMELLAETSAIVDKKQKNLSTLEARFRKEFKRIHPNLNPPI